MGQDTDSDPLLRDYQLALVLKLALGDRERTGSEGARATGLALARLCRLAVSSRCEADGEETPPAEFLMRMAYQQFWDQESYNVWPRGLIILRDMVRLIHPKDRYDIETTFADIYGLRFTTFVFLCFALFSMVTKQWGHRLGPEQFTSSRSFVISPQDAEAFLDLISLSLDEYREHANDPKLCMPGFETYNFNPLVGWPAIKHSAGGVVVPIPRLLLDRATKGIYYDFLQQLDEESAGRFGNFWGKAFESYVGELLRRTPGLAEPQKGETATTGGSACDWVLPCGDRYLLIECKTRGLTLQSKTTGRWDAIQRDIVGRLDGSSLPKGVAQLAETAATLKKQGLVRDESNCIPILVTLDQIYFANDDRFPIKTLLRQGAESLTNVPIPDFHVAAVSEIEQLCRAVETKGCDPAQALAAKASSSSIQTRWQDIGLFTNQTFKPPAVPISLHSQFLKRGMDQMLAEFRREAGD